MITDKDIEAIRRTIQKLIQEGLILPASQEQVDFFLNKARQSLETADLLLRISSNLTLKEELRLLPSYDSYVWVINASYYAMFYAATALLAKFNHRIKAEQSIHIFTYQALVYYFLDNDKKLTKHLLEQYKQAEEEASGLLQLAEQKAREQVEQVKLELSKRREFTYEMGKIAEKGKAQTSLSRAKEFLTLVKELII